MGRTAEQLDVRHDRKVSALKMVCNLVDEDGTGKVDDNTCERHALGVCFQTSKVFSQAEYSEQSLKNCLKKIKYKRSVDRKARLHCRHSDQIFKCIVIDVTTSTSQR